MNVVVFEGGPYDGKEVDLDADNSTFREIPERSPSDHRVLYEKHRWRDDGALIVRPSWNEVVGLA